MKKVWISLIFLSACRGGYKAPDVSMASEFITQSAKFDEKRFNPKFWENLNDPLLNQLVDLVETQNYDVLTAYEKISELRAQYRFQTSQLFPQISGGGSIRRERDTQTLTFSPFTGNLYQTIYQLGFDATWEVDLFGAQLAAKQGAFFSMMSQVEEAAFIKLSLVSELVLQYYNLRTNQALLANYEKEIDVLKEITDLAENRFGSGLNDQTGSLLNLARVQDKQSIYEKTKADRDKLIYLITQLTGQFPKDEYQTLKSPRSLDASIALIYPDIPSNIILNRPDVSSARFNLFSAQALLKKAYRDFFPQFSITGFFGSLTNFPGKIFKAPSIQWDIMPGFNVTLIDFGALIAQKNVAKSQEKQAIYKYENSLVNAFKEIETALSGVAYTNQQIASLESELMTLKQKTLDFKERFQVGLIEKTTYLESYLEELLIEQSLLNAINSRFGFTVAFYKALGVRL